MKKSLTAALALAASALALSFAAGAHAQSYSRLVSFGDSLSDNGNVWTATGSPPAPYNHRFTNDQVWSEYLSGTMQGWFTATSYTTGDLNLAWGGARSDSAANSNGPIPGTPSQIGYFQLHGGTFGANDVASIWAGANDLFQALPAAAGNPATAASVMGARATTTAGNVATQVGQLSTLGAKTIVVMNLPDLGKTPQFNTDPSASALTTLTTGVFNQALATGLSAQATAHADTNIIQVDVYSAFNAVLANPAAFGVTNATQACTASAACALGSQDTRNGYLFWDGVHPTATGHKLVSNLTAQYLYTPTLTQGVGLFADETYNTRRTNVAEMSDLLHNAQGGGGYFVQIVGNQASSTRKVAMQSMIGGATADADLTAYDYKVGGIRAGAVQAVNDGMSFGVGFTALTGNAKASMVEATPTDLSADVGLEWRPGAYFVGVSAGGGIGSYSNYTRHTTLAPVNEHFNNIKTMSYSASMQAGFDKAMGNWTVTPVARLSYASARMDGFSELGSIAAVTFEDRKVSATSGAVELRAVGKMGDSIGLSGVLGYEGVLSGDAGALKGKLQNNTAHAFTSDMGDVTSPGLLVGVGLSTKMMGFDVAAQYRGTFGSNDQKDQGGMLTMSKAF